MEKKILVCWNKCSNKEEDILNSKLRELLSYNDEKFFFNFAYSYEQLDDELNDIAKIHSLIVLCELTWSPEARPTDFKGIELVQQQIRVKKAERNPIALPILFLSFENNQNIVKIGDNYDYSRLIINTYGIGHHFIQLPLASDNQKERFWKMQSKLTEAELRHVLLYCNFASTIGLIKHNINENDLAKTRVELLNLLTKIPNIDEISAITEIINDINAIKIEKANKDMFESICRRLRKALKLNNQQ